MFMNLFAKSPIVTKIYGGPFRGAKVFLNPSNSKRKIFGLYEKVLNSWISQKICGKSFVFDVGANTGYDTYGFAFLLLKHGVTNPTVISFEPEAFAELESPMKWPEYERCKITLIHKYVGKDDNESTMTLDSTFRTYINDSTLKGLIKIDIEGAEVDALQGAHEMLQNPDHDWLIEIHGKELIPEVAKHFVEANRPFLIKELEPIPFLGKELRSVYTTWLVTI